MNGDDEIQTARFCELRSQVIDLFADVETEITKYVIAHSPKPPNTGQPLGQKITLAMKVAAGPQRSKALKAEADGQLSAIQGLLTDRAAIVHSRMTIARCVAGKYIAIFKNAKDIAHNSSNALVYEEDELRAFLVRLRHTVDKVSAALRAKNASPAPPK
jgi:hypothetical protein